MGNERAYHDNRLDYETISPLPRPFPTHSLPNFDGGLEVGHG